MSYLTRYEKGDHEPVWAELNRLGAAVRQEPLRSDAMAVARATMNRVRINLERLHARLLDLGFEFARPDEALVLAKPGASQEIDQLEAELGVLSLSGRAWFETFHTVRFEQAAAQVEGRTGPPDLHGLGSHPALIVSSLEGGLRDWRAFAKKIAEGRGRLSQDLEDCPPTLIVGPILSNCDTACFQMGVHHMDDLGFASDGREDASFLSHLRDCIRHGGFPFWNYCPEGSWGTPVPNVRRLYPLLRRDLIAF